MSVQSKYSRLQKISFTLVAASASAFLLAAAPAWSQTSSTGPGTGSTGVMGGTGNNTAGKPMGTTDREMKTTDTSKVSRGDASMMKDLAQGNMAEIASAKVALEKSTSEDTKKFAQMMIDDHTAALGDVQKLAADKGVTLPTEPSVMQKTKAAALLKATSGKLFEREYRRHAGVGDHESTVKLLKKIQKDGKDADFKALASKMLPTVEKHLAEAKALVAQKS